MAIRQKYIEIIVKTFYSIEFMSLLFSHETTSDPPAAGAWDAAAIQQYLVGVATAENYIQEALGEAYPAVAFDPYTDSHHDIFQYSDIFAASLNTPYAHKTVRLLSRMASIPDRPGISVDFRAAQELRAAAYDIIGEEAVLPQLIDLYKRNEDTGTGRHIMDMLVSRAAFEVWPFSDSEPLFRDFMAAELPKLLSRTAFDINSKRDPYLNDPEPANLTDPEKMELYPLAMAITNLLGSYPKYNISPIIQSLTKIWHSSGLKAIVDHVFDFAMQSSVTACERILVHWGLDPTELQWSWDHGYAQGKLPDETPAPYSPTKRDYVHSNLQTIRELEYRDTGSAKGLRRLFGIRNFARIHTNVLHMMYQRRFMHFAHNVLFTVASADHNGAFYRHPMWDEDRYKELADADIGMYIIEYESLEELKHMAASWQTHRPDELFDVIVHTAHGGDYSVTVRVNPASKETERVDVDDIYDTGGPLTQAVTHKASVNVMNSCNTGKKLDGIAATLAEESTRETQAPECPASIAGLAIKHANGQVTNVTVSYQHRVDAGDNTWTTQPLKTAIFLP